MGKYGTSFVESELILAASEDDGEEMDRLIDQMSAAERRRLAAAAYALGDRLRGPLGNLQVVGQGTVQYQGEYR